MTTKPYVHKIGNAWRVTIGTHMYASRATHTDAYRFAEGVAGYARRIRLERDIARTRKALERMGAVNGK